MTREETKKCIEIMQSYVDGKEIEYEVLENGDNLYISNGWPNWNWELCKYRIKQEPKPFDWRGKNIQWVKLKETARSWKVSMVNEYGIWINTLTLFQGKGNELTVDFIPSKNLFKDYEWSSDNATWRKFE